MKKWICFLLCLSLLLCGCSSVHHGFHTESFGFVDEKTEIEYTACNILSVKPITIGEEYCEADGLTYYTIEFEDPAEFLCDYDKESGSSYVYRAAHLPEITIENFNAIAAWLYVDGTTPQKVAQLYADDEYLDESLRGQNPSQDTATVRKITDAVLNGEHVSVTFSAESDTDSYEFRLLSADYPGLYYSVWFFGDSFGKYYLQDYVSGKTVLAPDEIVVWIVGGGDETY